MQIQKTNIPLALDTKRIFIINDDISKQDLVVKLVNAACADLPQINKEDVLSAVLKREQGISTTLDTGLSIPHARVEDLTAFQAAAAVLPNGITDDYGLQIKTMFLFLSPAGPAYFPQHLKLLAALAEKFNADFITDLTACKTEAEVLQKISF